MSYYRKKVYDSHNGDSGLNARTGQVVEVLRELTGLKSAGRFS